MLFSSAQYFCVACDVIHVDLDSFRKLKIHLQRNMSLYVGNLYQIPLMYEVVVDAISRGFSM